MQGFQKGSKRLSTFRRLIWVAGFVFLTGQGIDSGSCQEEESGGKPSAAETELAKLKFQFDVARARILKPRQQLNQKYRGALVKLKADFQGKGNLIGVSAVDKAIGDLDNKKFQAVKSPKELKRVQEIYSQESGKLTAQEAKQMGAASGTYRKQLEELSTKLTEARLQDEALKVKAVLGKVPVVAEVAEGLTPAMRQGGGFFGVRPAGNRILFVIDHSLSMNEGQVRAIAAEVENGLQSLKVGTLYQVIIFAGSPVFAEPGWKFRGFDKVQFVTDPGGKEYRVYSVKGASDFEFSGEDGDLPTSDWVPATSANIRSTLKVLRSAKQMFGTDWELALRVGHHMSPPPSAIFFISDGTGGNAPEPILAMNRKKGSPKIFTFAMQTGDGAEQFSTIARSTGGEFRIVLKDGQVINGDDYLKDPGKFAARLK